MTAALRRVLVVASSAELASPGELAQAQRVGRLLAENGITVLTDAGAWGPLGTVTTAALEAGGRVVGVALESSPPDAVHPDLTDRRTVPSETERARELGGLADGVLGLPGGFSDLAAAFAVWDWPHGARELPLGLVDEGGYYSELLKLAPDETVDRFVRESQRGLLIVARRVEEVLRRLADYRAPETRRNEPFDPDR